VLLKPIEARLEPDRTLLFEPDEYLATVPWEVLIDGSGRYLAQQFSSVVTPGFYWLTRHQSKVVINSESSALIVSVPSPLEVGMVPLSDADDEARAVMRAFSSGSWLQGRNATLTAILRELPAKSVFHFAGHGIALPQRTGLVLAELDPDTQHLRLLAPENLTSQTTANHHR
jgi:CHAT domain-containing protein